MGQSLKDMEQHKKYNLKADTDFEKLTWTVDNLVGTVEAYSLTDRSVVHEIALQVHSLIRVLINLYNRGTLVVRRVGGGYEYETGIPDTEAVEALSVLSSDGWRFLNIDT